MSLKELWIWGARELEAAKVADAKWQAELLLRGVLGIERAKFMAYPELEVNHEQVERFRDAIRKRSLGVPAQYILGKQEFFGREFVVNSAVLIPRPETELLVEEVLRKAACLKPSSLRILDLCTGSGCVGLTLAAELPHAKVIMTDISKKALAVARVNAERLGLIGRIELKQGDLFAPVAGTVFEAIVSNPPYIESEVIHTLSEEVQHEPWQALDGGRDGLAFYRRIAGECHSYLTPGGVLAVEIGHGQGQAVQQLFADAGLTNITLIHDLANLERVVIGVRRQN